MMHRRVYPYQRERERERECVCVCIYIYIYMCVCEIYMFYPHCIQRQEAKMLQNIETAIHFSPFEQMPLIRDTFIRQLSCLTG